MHRRQHWNKKWLCGKRKRKRESEAVALQKVAAAASAAAAAAAAAAAVAAEAEIRSDDVAESGREIGCDGSTEGN